MLRGVSARLRPRPASGSSRITRLAAAVAVSCVAFVQAPPASAFEFFDGAIEAHGYYEMQLRAMARDFSSTDRWDVTQWYHILNLEIEANIAPDGFGPFDLMTGFVRLEGRYDCVWTGGCKIFPSIDTFGDDANRQPRRLSDGRRAGFRSSGTLFNFDRRFLRDIPREFLPYENRLRPRGSRKPSPIFNIQGIDTLFDSAGVDGVFGTPDDPAPFYFDRFLRTGKCDFNFRATKGSQNGTGHQVMGPWRPDCQIRQLGTLRDRPNPLRAKDISPITGTGGTGELPLRPAPKVAAGTNPLDVPQGVYYPNKRLQRLIRDRSFDSFDQNFSQTELSFNRGASQEDEGELKEAYLDIEMFDSRLWLRLGKQTIVWGKTELFRNQDQWNPQDLALASLPSLEESRIGLWSARAVWHFWDVGPLEDVRVEFVALLDDFEPTDLGRCGEPYAPNPVCNKSFGLFAHGLTGLAIAGEVRPPDPWEDASGLEFGARAEWRWDRFSFALTNYYGHTDLFYQDELYRYSRNVDPVTGRPRMGMRTGACTTGEGKDCLTPAEALNEHSVNQQLFSMICATSIGFSALDTSACGQTVFNSQKEAIPGGPAISSALSAVVSGQGNTLIPVRGQSILYALASGLSGGTPINTVEIAKKTVTPTDDIATALATVLVPLGLDPFDGGPPAATGILKFDVIAQSGGGLAQYLTDEQEALLGCGPFYRTRCDIEGIDLMNAEASALFQSFTGFEGSFGANVSEWLTTDRRRAQPGTVGFDGGPVCTRYERGRMFILPGCRGPGDAGYNVRQDGSLTGAPAAPLVNPGTRVHPFTGQRFRSEMAVVSWNALMGLVGFSAGPVVTESVFDPSRPMRQDGCSFARPQLCGNLQSFIQITGVQRNTAMAGGNGRFGRRDFVWHGGRDIVLRYQKRNILGFSMDFAEDFTKSNIGIEYTWENDAILANNNSLDGLGQADRHNLTISVDRPTFINFLNANRTFFINGQLFVQFVDGYQRGFTSSGPWNFLGVLSVNTGYFDDRLLPAMTLVYDKRSNSSAIIAQVQYRFSAEFSATFGVAYFGGREEPVEMALSPNSLSNRTGSWAYNDFTENGLSAIRDRDEVFLRLRYTF